MKRTLLCVAAASAWQSAGPVFAQSASTASEATGSQDIIVTARKREERLSDLPASASVLSGAALAERGGAVTPVELLGGIPSVRVLDTGTGMTNEISIRGSPTSRGTTGDPSVGLFRDSAYIGGGGFSGRSFTRIDLFDIGRTEVLRGTQGALYGRNAVGGAVNIVSARPEFQTSGFANIRYAVENEQVQTQAVVNAALSDNLAVRIGVDHVFQNGGFFYNDFLDQQLDRNESTGFRGQIRYRGERTDILLRAEHWSGFVPTISFRVFIDPRAGFPQGYYQPERTYPWSSEGFSTQEVNGGLADITHRFDNVTLRSITNYRQRKADYQFDQDGINQPLYLQLRAAGIITANIDTGQAQQRDEDVQFFSQDLHLFGSVLNDRLDWLAGIEYLQVRSNSEQRNLRTPTVPNPSPGFRQPLRTTLDSIALYGSLEYKVDERFSLIGELRQTWDEKTAQSERFDIRTGLPSGGPGFVVDFTESPTNLSYNFTASWRARDSLLLYGKVGTAFRSGGFNQDLGVVGQPVPIPAIYDDETSTTFEAGLKATIMDNLGLDFAGYQTNSRNIIVQLNNGCFIGNPACSTAPVSFSDNGGKARVRGFEGELNGRIPLGRGQLRLTGGFSHQSGEVTEGQYDGQTLPQIPEWIFSAGATVTHPLSETSSLLFNFFYNGQRGGVHDLTRPATPPPFDMDKIDNLNLRTAVRWGMIEGALFVTNATNETYDVFRAASARRLNPPRNWGFELNMRW